MPEPLPSAPHAAASSARKAPATASQPYRQASLDQPNAAASLPASAMAPMSSSPAEMVSSSVGTRAARSALSARLKQVSRMQNPLGRCL